MTTLAEEFEAFVTTDDEEGDQEFGRFCQQHHAAILSALRKAGEGWLPISTAPKDGREILLATEPSAGSIVTRGSWLDNSKTAAPWKGWHTSAGPFREDKMLAWRPMPKHPLAA